MRYSLSDPPVFTLTAGPVIPYARVVQALSTPLFYEYDPLFLTTYQRVSEKLQGIVKSETVPVILQAEPVVALEAAAASLVGAQDVVLNLVSGVYGRAYGPWLARSGARVLELAVPYDRGIDADDVANFLGQHPEVTVVAACHHDTPSATINPVQEIGAVVARHGALFLVDAVSSFGGMNVDAASAQCDVFIAGPHKCLGGTSALSFIGVSRRAWAKMHANSSAPRSSILSILDWEETWRKEKPFPFTPSVSEIHGLEAAVDLYLAEGPERVWLRHRLTAEAFRAGVAAMGLSLWATEVRFASPTATAVRLPDGVDEPTLRTEMRAMYGVLCAKGRGEPLSRVLRFGHMGMTAQPLYSVVALAALGGVLRKHGAAVDLSAGVEAAMAVIDGAQ
jgi:pyridoxamine---pyruvate transaminase